MKKLLYLLILLPTLSFAQLGEYYYSDNHPKAKGLNFQIKTPGGYIQKEALRPNIVQKWDYGSGMDFKSFMVIIYKDESLAEFSKDEVRIAFRDKETRDDFLSTLPFNVSNSKYYVIDNYPGLIFDGYQDLERIDIEIRGYFIQAQVFVEEYTFNIQFFSADKDELNINRNLFNQIANSVVFPDQYNY